MVKVGLKLSVARNERQLAAGKIQSQFRTRKVATSQKAVLENQTQLQQVTVRSAKLEQALGCAAVKAEKDRSASKIQQSYRKRQQVSNEQGVREWHTEVTEAAAAVGAQYEEYRAEASAQMEKFAKQAELDVETRAAGKIALADDLLTKEAQISELQTQLSEAKTQRSAAAAQPMEGPAIFNTQSPGDVQATLDEASPLRNPRVIDTPPLTDCL